MDKCDIGMGVRGLLAGLGLLLIACDNGSNPASPEEPLVGKWNFTGASYTSEVFTVPESPDYPPEESISEREVEGDGYFIEFKANQSYSASFPSVFGAAKTGRNAEQPIVSTGEWSRDDSILTLIRSGETSPDTTRLTIRANTTSTTFFSTETFSLEVEEGYTSTSVTTIAYVAEKEASP